jgi:hypothetical protein
MRPIRKASMSRGFIGTSSHAGSLLRLRLLSVSQRADGGFNRSEQHLELEVCTWEDRKVGRPQSQGGPRSESKVIQVCDASIVRRSGRPLLVD